MKDFNVYSFLDVIKHSSVKDCFVICVGTSLLVECDNTESEKAYTQIIPDTEMVAMNRDTYINVD